jgi:hypothetical protein
MQIYPNDRFWRLPMELEYSEKIIVLGSSNKVAAQYPHQSKGTPGAASSHLRDPRIRDMGLPANW